MCSACDSNDSKMKDKNVTTSNKSIITKLKDQNKINDSILTCLNSTSYIVKDAILKFAISTTKSKKDAARFLGLTPQEFHRVCKQYDVNGYFD